MIENLLSAASDHTRASFYRTARGAEIDLVLELGGNHGTWAIEIKKGQAPKIEKGFYIALEDIKPNKAFIVHSGNERYPKNSDVEVIGLRELAEELSKIS